MGIRGHRLLASIFVLLLCPALRAADDAFAIKVQRTARPGDFFDIHLQFEQTRTETVAPMSVPLLPPIPAATASAPATAPADSGPPPKVTEHIIKAELTCRVEVVDVNFRGETTLWVTIGKFISLSDNQEMVPAGKVIGLQFDGMDIYLSVRGGGDLSEDARTVLKHVHPLEYQLNEESYGSKTPRKAGEAWDVNAVSVAQVDSNVALQVDPGSVKGKVTLAGAEKAGAIAALRMNVELTHSGKDRFRKSSGEMITRQEFKASISTLLPVDPALPPLQVQMVSDMVAVGNHHVEIRGKAEDHTLEIKTHTVEKQTITAAK